jgi:hypothetical protein
MDVSRGRSRKEPVLFGESAHLSASSVDRERRVHGARHFDPSDQSRTETELRPDIRKVPEEQGLFSISP